MIYLIVKVFDFIFEKVKRCSDTYSIVSDEILRLMNTEYLESNTRGQSTENYPKI